MAVTPQLVLTVLMGVLLVAVAGWLARVEDWRSYTPIGTGAGGYGDGSHHEEKPGGLTRWLTTVDHKDIGKLYALFGVVAFAWGGLAVLLMRVELMTPKADVISPTFYNGLMTTHGITMLFLFAAPFIFALGNYVVPLLVNADDMAFPRINAFAFWILPPATLLMWAGFFLQPLGINIAPAAMGWTMYTPLVTMQQNAGVDLFLLGFHLSGISTTLGAINFIATVVAERDSETVPWSKLDIFSWTILTQGVLILFAFPLLGAAVIMLLLDRNFATTFFTPGTGGGPLLFQHLFWFFGHPEVYILVLPPMGLVSLILPKFAGRKLFGFKFIVYSTLAIGILSFGVWAHHMFTTGLDPRLRTSFMAVSLAIGVPSAVKIFNWIATLWNGKLRMTAPMLFMLGAVQNFIIGGVTGVFLAAVPFDLVMQDTYYVVGHFHFIVYGMIGFALMGAFYYFFPMLTGRMYNKKLARWHFWTGLVGSNVTFFAMLILGYGGMPRRYATYLPRFTTWHEVATLGAILITISTAVWVWNAFQAWRAGRTIDSADPWNLKESGQFTNDWQWFERKRQTMLADGGEDVDADADTDASQTAD
ncbi:cbb3-type cytochrome c oxidase subunit I [Halocalculus aciditolerans]|uniref:Cytochrome-c oxidase n=1 Tax=Halocalculus aciditolerans TaxID=1383812 RepID=A0A830FCM3_9EURY|nr:cbb3-type cytochrome c oxidase subunit I [Halocalculus aciditolerans]GGL61420.1 cytochrome-c oxidase [Halocalculus aciditolerans]